MLFPAFLEQLKKSRSQTVTYHNNSVPVGVWGHALQEIFFSRSAFSGSSESESAIFFVEISFSESHSL